MMTTRVVCYLSKLDARDGSTLAKFERYVDQSDGATTVSNFSLSVDPESGRELGPMIGRQVELLVQVNELPTED